MASHNTIRLRSILINVAVIALLLMCIAVAVLTIMPTPLHSPAESEANVKRILAELPAARTRWQKLAITDYDIDGRAFVALMCAYSPDLPPATFHVRSQRVQGRDFSVCEEEMAKLLPPRGFSEVENTLKHFDTNKYFLDVQFDEAYGYISRYFFQCNDTGTTDCVATYEFSNFRRVNR